MLWGTFVKQPQTFLARYLSPILLLIYVMLVWSALMFMTKGDFSHGYYYFTFSAYGPFFLSSIMGFLGGQVWVIFLVPFMSYSAFLLAFTISARLRSQFLVERRGMVMLLSLLAIVSLILGCQSYERQQFMVDEDTENSVSEDIRLWDYRPFREKNKLTPLAGAATLQISQQWPRLDGATALYPVYASAVQEVYQGLNERNIDGEATSSRTPKAYKRLIDRAVDMIFVAEPSKEQLALAAEKNVELKLIPFAREAFVFLVSQDNPVNNLSIEQVRDIYAGKINNWNLVGGSDEKILPYQRPTNSGSQTIMLSKVMKDTPIRKPLVTEVAQGMGGLIRRVADYQNTPNALGYSFRYYASRMDNREKLKLLSIDGIEPTAENIRNGSYPFTTNVYMITRPNPSENTQKLIDWFLSPQGQKLVEDVGYVPISAVK